MMNTPMPPGAAEKILRTARASGNPVALGLAYDNVGRLYMMSGRWSEAHSLLEEAASLFQQIRDQMTYNATRSEIGHLYRRQGLQAEAATVYRETIQTYRELSQQAAVAHELECFAMLAAAQNQHRRAAQLFGTAEVLRERIDSEMTPSERREYDAELTNLRIQMDAADLEKSWAEGRGMDIDQAIAFALEGV